jgi:hypothetical protein
MPQRFSDRLQHAWNVLRNRDPILENFKNPESGMGYSRRPDRVSLTFGNEKSIVAAVYNRIAIDVAAIAIRHVRTDLTKDGRYVGMIDSKLNRCLSVEANQDQTGRALIMDIVMSMFDEGCVSVVPVNTSIDPKVSTSYDILSMRTARITEWFPSSVKVDLYNDATGQKEPIVLPKKETAIIENPLYAVMNEPNSTLKRLIYKLNLLDSIDKQSSSGKLDLIIQLPYVVKTTTRKQQADIRRTDIETQLTDSKYGIAWTDATEKITQLNRPVENNLMSQVEYLTRMLYSQLGMTESVLDGTADEKTMMNYFNRSLEPILTAIVEEFRRKFLTQTAISQGQSIMYFNNPFRFVPITQFADIADKLTRNEIASPNEIRARMGMTPDPDPESDKLRNRNLNDPGGAMLPGDGSQSEEAGYEEDPPEEQY